MSQHEQVRLRFDPVGEDGTPPATELSAAARIGNTLIAAGDEGGNLEIMALRSAGWEQVARVSLHDLIRLPADKSVEIDIEGLAVEGDWLWVVGSHSLKRQKPRGKSPRQDLNDLRVIDREANRFVLARLPLVRNKSGQTRPVARDGDRRPAMVEIGKRSSALLSWLAEDPVLAPFLDTPSKENGLDVEGIAVDRNHVWLGLRGPVLRGHAIVLQLDLKANKRDVLKAKKIDGTRRFRKYLLTLDGLGIRDLELDGNDLLVLTGPAMLAAGAARIMRWRDAVEAKGSEVVPEKKLEVVLELEAGESRNTPEAICRYGGGRLLVLHDNPSEKRLSNDKRSIQGDVYKF